MMLRKIGLTHLHSSEHKLVSGLLEQLEKKQLDYTISFDLLTRSLTSQSAEKQIRDDLGVWYIQWKKYLDDQPGTDAESQAMMRQANPVVIPRNHHMENTIQTCIETGEASSAEDFIEILGSPYTEENNTSHFQDAPVDRDFGYQTFCGT